MIINSRGIHLLPGLSYIHNKYPAFKPRQSHWPELRAGKSHEPS